MTPESFQRAGADGWRYSPGYRTRKTTPRNTWILQRWNGVSWDGVLSRDTYTEIRVAAGKDRVNRAALTRYPEHEKLKAIKDKSQEIGTFLDYTLPMLGLVIAQRIEVPEDERDLLLDEDTMLVPAHQSIQELLSAHFGIDQDAIDREKRQMLDDIRSAA